MSSVVAAVVVVSSSDSEVPPQAAATQEAAKPAGSQVQDKPSAAQVISDVRANPPLPTGSCCPFRGKRFAVQGEPIILGTSVDGNQADVVVEVTTKCVACPVEPREVGCGGKRKIELRYRKFDTERLNRSFPLNR